MSKVSIIIRAYNRLEYTIETLNNVLSNTNYPDLEIIVVNNASTDGTTQWLDWVKVNSDFYKDIKHIKSKTNLGDWGGMIEGLNHTSANSKYIVQLDNDVVINDPEWVNKMIHVLSSTDTRIVMLKRIGVINKMLGKNHWEIKYGRSKLKLSRVKKPVCCYMLDTNEFRKFLHKNPGLTAMRSKTTLAKHFKTVTKIQNCTCNVHINNDKYMMTNKNVWERL